jgi:hypothetical protein
MSDTNFQPIFDYIDNTKKELLSEMEEKFVTKSEIAKLQNTVDSIALSFKNNDDKVKVVEEKTTRIENWVMKTAEKVDVPINPKMNLKCVN